MEAANRGGLAAGLTRAACCYWLEIFPHIRRETGRWQTRARAIPDPALRQLALATHKEKWGNIEGAGAFAILAAPAKRPRVIRALVAIQGAYDYADTLSEQPNSDPQANGYQLHLALLTALTPAKTHPDYYTHNPQRDDNDYLAGMVDACRMALSTLPSHQVAIRPARRAALRIATYQSLNHNSHASHENLKRWARTQTPPATGVQWWETAAAAASSLAVLALIAAAAQAALTTEATDAIEHAYYPWIGALHTLLDSLIDYPQDTGEGQPSLIAPYASPHATASAMQRLTEQSIHHAQALPAGREHLLILAAMASLYLCSPQASLPHARLATNHVLHAIGVLAAPTLLISRTRRRLHNPPPHVKSTPVATPLLTTPSSHAPRPKATSPRRDA